MFASLPRVAVGSSHSDASIASSSSSSIRFPIDRPLSPKRSLRSPQPCHVLWNDVVRRISIRKATCMCSPTSDPGPFRCSLHKDSGHQPSVLPSRSNVWSLAMKNSVVRIGGVEGDLVRRALTALIRPSSHHQRLPAAAEPVVGDVEGIGIPRETPKLRSLTSVRFDQTESAHAF